MARKTTPKNIHTSVGGSVGGHIVTGSHNVIAAPKPVNDRGTFLPMARNALFTGREAALMELGEALTGDKSVVITQAISGMGGIGKSQLALEFAYRSADYFVSAHWLNLADPTQLDAEIAACGQQMGLAYAQQPEQVSETLRVWAGNGPRLLVLDNYEAAGDALQTLAPLLNLPTVRLLITARRADFPPELGLRSYSLEVFTPPDSLAFLRKLVECGDEQIPDLETLAETLGHLPLALHLAGHYLRETEITLVEYLRELGDAITHESMQAERFQELGIASPTVHDQSLLGTFSLSWQKLTDEHAQILFKVAGYLAPNTPIPLEIFAVILELEEKDRTLKRALRQLQTIGLFTTKDGLPVIHPLLAAYARYLNGESKELLETLLSKLGTLSKKAIDTGLPTRFAPLSPHIAVAARHAEQVTLEYAGMLWNNYGYYLWEVADYTRARAAYEHTIQIGEVSFGENHPLVAIGVNNLGTVLQDLGDLEGARAAFERALKIDETIYGKEHPTVARDVNNLGNALRDLGDLDGARAAYERAIQIAEVSFGENHPLVATGVNNLGVALDAQGNLDGARAAYERALKIDEAIYGKEHPDIARDVNNLGNVLQHLGNLDGARVAYENAIRIWESTLGENHPKVATGLNNLGTVLKDLGDLNGARATFERAQRIDEAVFGKEHYTIAIRVNNLGSVLQHMGDLDGACAAYEHAIRILEANLGENHPDVGRSVLNLGTVLRAQGQKEQARTCGERALAIYEQFLPAGHARIENVKEWLKSLEE